MSAELIVAIMGGTIGVLGLLSFLAHRSKHIVRTSVFAKKWKELQKHCAHKDTWSLAVIEADALLDRALRKKGFKGKTMGERLVSAEKYFTGIEGIWSAHKLKSHIAQEPGIQPVENEVKSALVSIRQGLRDLGVLK
jgi:hypothetical protein